MEATTTMKSIPIKNPEEPKYKRNKALEPFIKDGANNILAITVEELKKLGYSPKVKDHKRGDVLCMDDKKQDLWAIVEDTRSLHTLALAMAVKGCKLIVYGK